MHTQRVNVQSLTDVDSSKATSLVDEIKVQSLGDCANNKVYILNLIE